MKTLKAEEANGKDRQFLENLAASSFGFFTWLDARGVEAVDPFNSIARGDSRCGKQALHRMFQSAIDFAAFVGKSFGEPQLPQRAQSLGAHPEHCAEKEIEPEAFRADPHSRRDLQCAWAIFAPGPSVVPRC